MAKVISITKAKRYSIQQTCMEECFGNSLKQKANLNRFCESLMSEENRKRFRAFPEGYCREFFLDLEQTHAITDLDFPRLIQLGGTLVNLERLASTYSMDMLELCAEQADKSIDEIEHLFKY